MTDAFDHHTNHQVGTEPERLAKAAALARAAAELLWEAGVVLRGLSPNESYTEWGKEARRINYEACTVAGKARDVASDLDKALPLARDAKARAR